MLLTDQQNAILTSTSTSTNNLLIEARAGTGKTTTLMQLLPRLQGNAAILAFNKSIQRELAKKLQDAPMQVQMGVDISTVHAAGLSAFKAGSGVRTPRVQGGKVAFIQKDYYKASPNAAIAKAMQPHAYLIRQIVSAAKNNGFGCSSEAELFPSIEDDGEWQLMLEHFNYDMELEKANISCEAAIAHARVLLQLSNNNLAMIDFDDMVYLTLLNNYPLKQYANVLIDEAQDISPTRRELAFRMLRPGGRIIAVGDEYQAIYGFTGADANSLNQIARRAKAERLPLTTCWRCDSNIIAEAQKQVPDIVARPNADSGTVTTLSYPLILSALGVGAPVPADKLPKSELLPQTGDAILCRLNKPNVSMALALLKAGLRARIEGKDLGKRLVQLVKSSDSLYAHRDASELIVTLEEWGQDQARQLEAKERKAAADLLLDEVGCAIVLLERLNEQLGSRAEFSDFEMLVADLFDDDIPPAGVITLSSVHKAKGREWPRVFILGRSDYMPHYRATVAWEKQQERNLIYVAITRAEHSLTYVTEVQSTLEKGA